MSTNQDLTRLFAELKIAGSPLRQMKILGRAWRTLRRLSPQARQELAAQVGIDGAGDVLEQLAGENRKLSPAALLAALEALRSAKPEDLRRTLRDLRRPDGRRALLDRSLDLLAGGPEDEESAPLSPAPPTVVDAVPLNVPASQSPSGEPPRPARDTVRPQTVAVAGAGAAVGARRLATPSQRHAAVRERRRVAAKRPQEREPVKRDEPVKPKPTRKAATAMPKAVRQAAPVPAPVPAPAPSTTKPAAQEPSPPAAQPARIAGSGLVETLAKTDRLSAKFRILRARVDEAHGMSVKELRRLIDTFPTDWSRRRALNGLLDRRIPNDLHRAIYLIESLELRVSQRWCIARILHGWPLTEHEREALLARRGTFIRRAG